ncbi:MAG: carboxypeptidase regulatory-like domain-containing protein [Chitinophagaceae bacterium]|nr:MAG: carboxypeptidase regulatory-like domain-containing protein [Chitinophagaceae bacterium]
MNLRRYPGALVLAVLFSALLFHACRKSADPDTPGTPGTQVTASVTGRVLDENTVPVNGATVRAGSASASTDINGNFALNNVSLDAAAAYITVSRNGYFQGSRTFRAKAGGQHFVQVQLLPRTLAGNFTATSGGSVSTGGGGSVQFPANALVNASGAAYSGVASVAAFTYDPTSAAFALQMPGELRGVDAGGQQQALQSFAMINIELQGAAGEPLQLAAGKTATITFPIAAALQASAPNSVPLWYFDELKGLWKQEGTATRQGNTYVGTVAHFTPWNVDVAMGVWTTLNARFLSSTGAPLNWGSVTLRALSPDTMRVLTGYIGSDGTLSMGVYANTQIRMTISGPCGQVLTSQVIGPFTAGTDNSVGDITTSATNMSSVTISGTVNNCSSAPLASGWVTGTYNSLTFRSAVTNGSYSLNFTGCNTGPFTATLTAFDPASLSQGSSVVVTGTVGTPATANLSSCGTTTTTLVSYTLGGVTSNFVPPGDSLSASYSPFQSQTYISCYTQSGNVWNGLDMTLPAPAGSTGTFSANSFLIRRPNNGQQQYLLMNSISANITSYGAAGSFIEGTFNGQVRDSANPTVALPITGTFKVRRTL